MSTTVRLRHGSIRAIDFSSAVITRCSTCLTRTKSVMRAWIVRLRLATPSCCRVLAAVLDDEKMKTAIIVCDLYRGGFTARRVHRHCPNCERPAVSRRDLRKQRVPHQRHACHRSGEGRREKETNRSPPPSLHAVWRPHTDANADRGSSHRVERALLLIVGVHTMTLTAKRVAKAWTRRNAYPTRLPPAWARVRAPLQRRPGSDGTVRTPAYPSQTC